ncbi:ComF family protein [Leuconostoc litchii]|nr:phosphoribosyltransferase family protein [Leuconostoc litchii]
MQQYKFTGDYMLRKIFNRQLIQLVHNTNMDLVVPIPVSQYTMRTRGFNQVTGMLEGIQLTNALQVISVKKRQQSNLNRNDRMKRKQLFDIQDSTLIIGKSILLVDDVYTTGSTLHCAAELLISCGAVSVKSVSLAR